MSDEQSKGWASALDVWDVLCLVGVVLLGAGLWSWFGLPVALTVIGGLVLALGVIGARSAAPAAPVDDEEVV